MPLYIGEVSSEVSAVNGELPLSEAQLSRIVELVLRRLEEVRREKARGREATQLRRESAPPSPLSQ